MVWRVVCGRELVIAIFAPTSALVSVDLPVFGRPTKQTKPDRNCRSPDSGIGGLVPLGDIENGTRCVGEDDPRTRGDLTHSRYPRVGELTAHHDGRLETLRAAGDRRGHRRLQ